MTQDSSPLVSAQALEILHQQAILIGKKNNQRGESLRQGQQHSTRRGAGLELDDLRNYQAGDDVRHIAWRASARQSTPLRKVFLAEQQERRLICLEHHAGMLFGTQKELKASRAVKLAAALCFGALSRGADIASMLASSKIQQWQHSHRLDDSLEFLRHANQAPVSPAPITKPTQLLKQIQQLAKQHSQICIISDFFHWHSNDFHTLSRLGIKHSLIAFHIVDSGEMTLNNDATLRLMDSSSGTHNTINTDSAALRQAYSERMQAKVDAIRQQLQRAGADYVYCDDELPLLTLIEDKL